MNYYELKLTLLPNTEINRDVCSALLAEIGFESFVESDKGLDAYIPEKLYSEENMAGVLENLPLPDTTIKYHIELVKSRDWNEEWEKNFFQPIIIDNQVVIHSSFHKDIPKSPYDIVIDPKMAFGTGHHSTTGLMVSYLLELDLKNKSFLDMGCGTAVLAILAKMKGANPVTAIDIDEWAYENSLENIRLNNTPDIQVALGDASILGKAVYDIIFANINRNILLNDIPVYASCMHSGAALFMSGFYQEDLDSIINKCREHQLQFVSYKEKDNWTAVYFSKQ
ncbi:MAG: 50S ribosomal protein L11 methyltransferase [Candidatus Symbiothrix sp.]|jgi:ribosomal protein L11 methyltransferase|nr:50S ribosomal protein L11 methyltransferase [Candidatus Symbiothrix sp.]